MQKCGAIEKFDMLFHKGGPMVGQSRGYAFVTFTQNEGATNAIIKLDGTNVGNRCIAVRLAKNIKYVSEVLTLSDTSLLGISRFLTYFKNHLG